MLLFYILVNYKIVYRHPQFNYTLKCKLNIN